MLFLLFITLVHITLPLENYVLIPSEWHFILSKDLFNRLGMSVIVCVCYIKNIAAFLLFDCVIEVTRQKSATKGNITK